MWMMSEKQFHKLEVLPVAVMVLDTELTTRAGAIRRRRTDV
jgi:hypothetical protein